MKFIKCSNCGSSTEIKLNNNGQYSGECAVCESTLTVKGEK